MMFVRLFRNPNSLASCNIFATTGPECASTPVSVRICIRNVFFYAQDIAWGEDDWEGFEESSQRDDGHEEDLVVGRWYVRPCVCVLHVFRKVLCWFTATMFLSVLSFNGVTSVHPVFTCDICEGMTECRCESLIKNDQNSNFLFRSCFCIGFGTFFSQSSICLLFAVFSFAKEDRELFKSTERNRTRGVKFGECLS